MSDPATSEPNNTPTPRKDVPTGYFKGIIEILRARADAIKTGKPPNGLFDDDSDDLEEQYVRLSAALQGMSLAALGQLFVEIGGELAVHPSLEVSIAANHIRTGGQLMTHHEHETFSWIDEP